MCRRTAKSSPYLIPVVFAFKNSTQWLKSSILQLGAHHPVSLDFSECSIRSFEPNSAGMDIHRCNSCHNKQECRVYLGTEFHVRFNMIWKCLSGFTSVFTEAYNPYFTSTILKVPNHMKYWALANVNNFPFNMCKQCCHFQVQRSMNFNKPKKTLPPFPQNKDTTSVKSDILS